MRRATQGLVVGAMGGATAYLAHTNAYGAYLMPAMRLPLLAAGLVMAALGTATVVPAALGRPRAAHPQGDERGHGGERGPDDGHGDGDGHGPEDERGHGDGHGDERGQGDERGHGDGHGHGDGDGHGTPRVAWLLLLPLVAAIVLRPPALGADAVRRDSAAAAPRRLPASELASPSAPRDGAVDMTHGLFMSRAYYDDSGILAGLRVRLTGFVVGDPSLEDGYVLTRFSMACCAGDALPLPIEVIGLDEPPPPDDTWLEVVGEWVPPAAGTPPGPTRGATVRLVSQVEIDPPDFPYE